MPQYVFGGRPISLGPMTADVRRLAEFARDAARRTVEWMRTRRPAKTVATRYYDLVRGAGFGDCLVYGPRHGLGMMEVERPWVETTSEYELAPNMTFQIDTFLARA